jgi:putative phosphoesterase
MKIIVMSDSHGIYSSVRKVINLQRDADLFVFLGDGEKDMLKLLQAEPKLEEKFLLAQGNCDSGRLFPQMQPEITYTLPFGHRLFAAHGHAYHVGFGTEYMAFEAKNRNADIVLYGHTHVRDERYEDGIYILNPGSMGIPRDGKKQSYGVISVTERGVLTNIMDIPTYG